MLYGGGAKLYCFNKFQLINLLFFKRFIFNVKLMEDRKRPDKKNIESLDLTQSKFLKALKNIVKIS